MLFLFLSLILSHGPSAFAEVAYTETAPTPPGAAAYQRDCERRYLASQCDDFFADFPDLVQFKVDCRQPLDTVAELKKLGQGGLGAVQDTWTALTDMAKVIWNGPASFRRANRTTGYPRRGK
jgi:hypothetical protein